MVTIADRLRGMRRVHVDSMAIIYFIERHPVYGPVVRPLFELLAGDRLVGVSSTITLLEVMVHPIRQGRSDLALVYRDTLARHFALFPVDRTIAEGGAEIRAHYSFTTADAIQLATAVQHDANGFVTNDRGLERFDKLEILILDDYLTTPESAQG